MYLYIILLSLLTVVDKIESRNRIFYYLFGFFFIGNVLFCRCHNYSQMSYGDR